MKKGLIYIFVAMSTIFLAACGAPVHSDSNNNRSNQNNSSDQNNQSQGQPPTDDSWVADQRKEAEQNMSSVEKLINDIEVAAEKGRMYPDSSVAIGEPSQNVINAYGSPEKSDGISMSYTSKYLKFELANGMVKNIVYNGPELESITKSDVTNTLGKPSSSEFEGGSEYYDYDRVGNYRLSIAFDENSVVYVYVE